MTRRTLSVILILAALLSLFGCSGTKDYTYCEIGFSLPASYRQIDASTDFDMAFESGESVIGVRRLSFDAIIKEGILDTHTPLAFASIYRDRLGVSDASPIFEHEYIPYFTYILTTASGRYVYMPTFYRTPYAYFVIILISKNELNEGGRVKFLEICESVYLLPEYA